MPKKIGDGQPRTPQFMRAWRVYRTMTQLEVAERLGTTETSIGRIELGDQPYTQESIEAIARVLRCRVIDLLKGPPKRMCSGKARPGKLVPFLPLPGEAAPPSTRDNRSLCASSASLMRICDQSLAQFLARPEEGNCPFGHNDLLSGAGIAPRPARSLPGRKDAKSAKLDAVAIGESRDDFLEDRIDDLQHVGPI